MPSPLAVTLRKLLLSAVTDSRLVVHSKPFSVLFCAELGVGRVLILSAFVLLITAVDLTLIPPILRTIGGGLNVPAKAACLAGGTMVFNVLLLRLTFCFVTSVLFAGSCVFCAWLTRTPEKRAVSRIIFFIV